MSDVGIVIITLTISDSFFVLRRRLAARGIITVVITRQSVGSVNSRDRSPGIDLLLLLLERRCHIMVVESFVERSVFYHFDVRLTRMCSRASYVSPFARSEPLTREDNRERKAITLGREKNGCIGSSILRLLQREKK